MDSQKPESVGERIRRLRIERDMSQEDLAQEIGVTAQAISRLERGDSQKPQRSTMRGYAKALETTTEYLLTGTDPTPDAYTEMTVEEFLRGHADLENPEHVEYLLKTWHILRNLESQGEASGDAVSGEGAGAHP